MVRRGIWVAALGFVAGCTDVVIEDDGGGGAGAQQPSGGVTVGGAAAEVGCEDFCEWQFEIAGCDLDVCLPNCTEELAEQWRSIDCYETWRQWMACIVRKGNGHHCGGGCGEPVGQDMVLCQLKWDETFGSSSDSRARD